MDRNVFLNDLSEKFNKCIIEGDCVWAIMVTPEMYHYLKHEHNNIIVPEKNEISVKRGGVGYIWGAGLRIRKDQPCHIRFMTQNNVVYDWDIPVPKYYNKIKLPPSPINYLEI